MSVKLEFTDEQATLVWCRGGRASKGFKEAVEKNDKASMIYYGTAMYMVLAQVADAAPSELAPDGNETDKP